MAPENLPRPTPQANDPFAAQAVKLGLAEGRSGLAAAPYTVCQLCFLPPGNCKCPGKSQTAPVQPHVQPHSQPQHAAIQPEEFKPFDPITEAASKMATARLQIQAIKDVIASLHKQTNDAQSTLAKFEAEGEYARRQLSELLNPVPKVIVTRSLVEACIAEVDAEVESAAESAGIPAAEPQQPVVVIGA
jgi:hypothetical protein